MFKKSPPDKAATKTIKVWTDGACSGNPGPGGWGVLLVTPDGVRSELSGAERKTTNNRMELLAAITALETLAENHASCHVTLHTDSTYVKDGLNKWLPGWKKNGWKTAARKPVKNQDLWQRLDDACATHRIEWRWVRGHTGDAGNEYADMLARKAVSRL